MRISGALLAVLLPAVSALKARRDGDDCECLNWSGVYERHGAKCGEGHEFSFTYRKGTPSWLGYLLYYHELCREFLHKLEDNSCINIVYDNAPGQWYNNQWCYVAKECKDAHPVNGSYIIGMKWCKPGVDSLLRDKTPEELHEMAKIYGLNTGVLVKAAYQIEMNIANWSMIEPLYHDDATINLARQNESTATQLLHGNSGAIRRSRGEFSELAKSRVDARALARLEELQASGEAYVLDSENFRAPFAIIKGGKTWLMEKDPTHYRDGLPWTYTKFRCIRNCGSEGEDKVVYTQ